MSYCVHCGVELDKTAASCPLCHTPVLDPNGAVDRDAPTPFPTHRATVAPVSKRELALLLTVLFLSVSASCGLLNLVFYPERSWSLYLIGAAVMLWIWLVPPLLKRKMPLAVRLLLDMSAVGIYVYCIAVDLDGMGWFRGLALPIVLLAAAVLLFLGVMLGNGRRSILSSIILLILCVGVFLAGVEYLVDTWLTRSYEPTWSLVVGAVCIALAVPLTVIRHVPSLREEVRRRFHM